jgi:feruloyl esterase
VDHFKYVVFKDPNWDWRALNFDTDVTLADKVDNGMLNAMDANLKVFVGHGGKLLMYHGWNDQLISPQNTINYYRSVADKLRRSVRLFMVPGMNHCAGGDGTSTFDAVSVMEQWVEQKKAPKQILASHMTNGAVDRTRPLCPYPQVAQYKGTGSTDDVANFTCK